MVVSWPTHFNLSGRLLFWKKHQSATRFSWKKAISGKPAPIQGLSVEIRSQKSAICPCPQICYRYPHSTPKSGINRPKYVSNNPKCVRLTPKKVIHIPKCVALNPKYVGFFLVTHWFSISCGSRKELKEIKRIKRTTTAKTFLKLLLTFLLKKKLFAHEKTGQRNQPMPITDLGKRFSQTRWTITGIQFQPKGGEFCPDRLTKTAFFTLFTNKFSRLIKNKPKMGKKTPVLPQIC